jgi:hypothetical protein
MPKGEWIETYTGRPFYPLDPDPSQVDLRDIAHSLSMQCRFAGHSRWHYSVAQHSVLVARHLPSDLAPWGLLHDASEAYLIDLPRPVKYEVEGYREAEVRVMMVIAQKFGLEWPEPDAVKIADNEALSTEKRDLLHESCEWGIEMPTPWKEPIERWTHEHAESTFLAVADKLHING